MSPEKQAGAFFLTTAGEYGPLTRPRACWVRGRLRNDRRDDYMLVGIDPPLIGQRFGLGAQDIPYLILSTRHAGHTLFPIDEWPAHVYVARLLDESVIQAQRFISNQVELIAWGLLFKSFEDAQAEAQKFDNANL